MIDNVIVKLLLLDGNETNLLDNIDDYKNFRRLLIELMKVKYDIRWCSNRNCSCHPETRIDSLLSNNKELLEFIEKYSGLNDVIENLTSNYKPITVYDRGYLE